MTIMVTVVCTDCCRGWWGEMGDVDVPVWVPTAGADDPVLPRESEGEIEDWQLLARSVA